MTAHCANPTGSNSSDHDDTNVEWWTYPCRCEGEFRVDVADLEAGLTVFPCSGCTMRCRVVYYAIEEDDGEEPAPATDPENGQADGGADRRVVE
ncbi:hypothetical protein BCR44DRAFT_1434519 [Catenaria anguillulae PL171]|uniref:DPH-type MB domain-containing protein n=1 Tax=Catenaria anguillulae PL171 TaxID=765915 RepID=A0A1Y2HKU1_9FUNG|nr:hypothetical protein BCR44DRAFT_1434519 [Catenaria anguillulae PL171]